MGFTRGGHVPAVHRPKLGERAACRRQFQRRPSPENRGLGRKSGWEGIRTPVGLSPDAVFKTAALDHSATHPKSFPANGLTLHIRRHTLSYDHRCTVVVRLVCNLQMHRNHDVARAQAPSVATQLPWPTRTPGKRLDPESLPQAGVKTSPPNRPPISRFSPRRRLLGEEDPGAVHVLRSVARPAGRVAEIPTVFGVGTRPDRRSGLRSRGDGD